jgi:hypothetical protein
MEVKEIVQTIIREPVLEVHFRMDVDGDDVIRIKEFIIGEINDYGYEVFTENLNIFDSIVWSDEDYDDDGYSDIDEEPMEVDEDELIIFMNEFFVISNDIPEPEFF